MRFTLEIELGNEAMQTVGDVLKAFQPTLGNPLDWTSTILNVGDGSKIRDVNGQAVGKWEVTESARTVSHCTDE
jgi:hypothetical protein